MLKYGTDKPDLRNPLTINDITKIFTRDDIEYDIFKKYFIGGKIIKEIYVPNRLVNFVINDK